MRQLLEEGWMLNRARLVAASYLTRTLELDRRLGAAHLDRHLVDGDPASNIGN
jgi:deoxyribodipyrimidine photo-lyase